jgi:predicted ATPase
MRISELEVENFRTFKDLETSLGKFNLLIGANASGKSNFLDIIEFVSHIGEHGLEDAVSMQGGIEEVANRKISDKEEISLDYRIEDIEHLALYPTPIHKEGEGDEENEMYRFGIKNVEFGLSLDFNGNDYRISREKVHIEYEVLRAELGDDDSELEETDYNAELGLYRDEESFDWKVNISDELPEAIEMDESQLREQLQPGAVLEQYDPGERELVFSGRSPLDLIFGPVLESLREITVYDIHPHVVRTGTTFSGRNDLEPDGQNLPIVLKDIEDDEEKSEKFRKFCQDLLPFVEDFKIEKTDDRSLFFKLKEIFGKKDDNREYTPSSMISDGTVNIFSLIIALFFEDKPIVGIEEPERNIHPSLISKVVDYMEDASESKQVFATTHNPELLKNTKIENVKMLRRNENGFSEVLEPREDERIKAFLENDIGIDEIQKENLVG